MILSKWNLQAGLGLCACAITVARRMDSLAAANRRAGAQATAPKAAAVKK